MDNIFRKIATRISIISGHSISFVVALTVVIVWGVSGPLFNFSNSWQLVINTATTITTFLMVFLIQNTQNRDGKAMQLKLDELIMATKSRNAFVGVEDMTDEELDELVREFQAVHEQQAGGAMMKKLHERIAAEHARRNS
jgi:low affinity Fe/Cu permease